MLDFLNLSPFEMLLQSDFVQNGYDPQVVTSILCILRTLLIWPIMHILYKVVITCIYFLDRNKNNRDNLRSSRIKRYCGEDRWREYWECQDDIHGISPSLKYECIDCKNCDKGNARCKNIKYNDYSLYKWHRLLGMGCIVFAFLVCNPFLVLKYLGFGGGLFVLIISYFLNPISIFLTYKMYDLDKHGRPKSRLLFKAKHSNPYANILTEMHEDGAFLRYYRSLPEGCKIGSPDAAMGYAMNGPKQQPYVSDRNVVSEQIARQRIIGAINNSWHYWW